MFDKIKSGEIVGEMVYLIHSWMYIRMALLENCLAVSITSFNCLYSSCVDHCFNGEKSQCLSLHNG